MSEIALWYVTLNGLMLMAIGVPLYYENWVIG